MKYQKLFTPGKIGNVEIKNRVVVTAMGTGLNNSNGEVSQQYIDYVTERARGGLGLFITEVVMTDEEHGRNMPFQLAATRMAHLSGWRRLADSVHKYGTKIFAQLWHPGRQTPPELNGGIVYSSGDMPGVRYPAKPRMLTKEQIKDLIEKFVFAAKLVQQAGVDGVELHAAHTYLIHQFISPGINNRTDEYGGSFENRMRFCREIVEAIREACGPAYPISVRISATENLPGWYELDEGVRIAKYLEEIGVDAINVSNGIAESTYTIQEPPPYEQGWKIGNAREIKKHVKVPLIAVSQIRQPAYAEHVLEQGWTDFIGNTRGHVADPHWCNKAMEGDDLAIRPCVSCLYCFEQMLKTARCAVNPTMGREAELRKPVINGNGRTVAVVGAGPAGLEAARLLGVRGFKPVVFEKTDLPGGALQLANKPLHKERIDWLIDNMTYQVKKAGGEIRTGTPATIPELKALDPYAVVVATGCKPLDLNIPGQDQAHVYEVSDYLQGKVSFKGKKIAVLGGGTTGCETAEKLAFEGNDVTVVEMREDIGLDMFWMTRWDFIPRMENLGVKKLVNCKVEEITAKGIVCQDIKENKKVEQDFDAVILSIGFAPENSMTQAIKDNFENVRVIGDAVKVRKIADAIFEGYSAGYTLGETSTLSL